MAEKESRYVYTISDLEETGFPIVSCEDRYSRMTVRTMLGSDSLSFPTFVAYIGARFSRDRKGMLELAKEIKKAFDDGKYVPEQRLANIVTQIKHQSPAGMSHVVLAIENLPIIIAAALFRRTVLHDGQEASTRYIDFASGNHLPRLETLLPVGCKTSKKLEAEYRALEQQSIGLYLKWFQTVREAYAKYYKINPEKVKESDALTARTYDTVRRFLLCGLETSMVYVTNATNVQQIIGGFGAGRLPTEAYLAQNIKALLCPDEKIDGYVPEIASLLKHTEPRHENGLEQKQIENYLASDPKYKDLLSKRRTYAGIAKREVRLQNTYTSTEKIIAQHILNIHPALRMQDAVEYVRGLSDKQVQDIGRIIFSDRDRFVLPSVASAVSDLSVGISGSLAVERDLGRHRAWERWSPVHETYGGFEEIAQLGFTEIAYLDIPEFALIQLGMREDMNDLYEKRAAFLNRLGNQVGNEAAQVVGAYLLPLGQLVEMNIHGDFQKLVHLEDLRVREGADIEARLDISDVNGLVAEAHPIYRSKAFTPDRVSVTSRRQFISRD